MPRAGADVIENQLYRFFSDGRDADRGCVMGVYCERYSITPADVLSLERMFQSVPALPWFVSHPLLAQIMRVDYS